MNILICIENLQMDGVKRVATVVGNKLAEKHNLAYYSLSTNESFFHLEAPLIKAKHPVNSGKSFREDRPLQRNSQQINDLVATIEDMKIDLVVLTAGLFTSFAPLIKERVPAVKLVAWMHNNYKTYMEQYYKGMKAELLTGLGAVDTVVALTEPDAVEFAKHNPNTVRIHNPVTLENNGRSELTEKVIISVCRLDIQHKGLDYLLELAALLPDDWQIKLVGEGNDKEWLESNIEVKKLGKKILFLGPLSGHELQECYRKASIFLMTSRWEGLPLVIGEAMNFGLPIVSMWNTGAQEYLQKGKYGVLTKDHDVMDLYRQMLSLMNSLLNRQHFSELSLRRARDFSLEHIVNEWLFLFESLDGQENPESKAHFEL